jgi:Na+-transporting methylmalonyl-CoA/oxaloacetate decarboxylase gamma subunit
MKWFKNNGLSLVFLVLFFITFAGQILTGFKEYNNEMQDEGGQQVSIGKYFSSGHFIEATFENFESEFLQMALFIVLSAWLYQKGSSESKDPDSKEETDREPNPKKKGAPWPVRKGGTILWLYKNSLSIVFFLLFILSFVAHLYGSLKHYNQEQSLKGLPLEKASEYLWSSQFWFESFQNWQSEFLSVFSIVILSIYLRQKGSAQSKPVDAPHSETGE